MRVACQYAVVRFMPHVETSEFGNVGIVLCCPEIGFFDFDFTSRGWGRMSRFFDGLDSQVYRDAVNASQEELARVRALVRAVWEKPGAVGDGMRRAPEVVAGLFAEMTRAREGIVHFGAPRVVLAEDPAETLSELFSFYVRRSFVTREYQEAVLERGMRQLLSHASLADFFVKRQIGTEEFHVNLPFVHIVEDCPVKAIKPLHLAHLHASEIIDHGGHWVDRIRRLGARRQLPKEVLFAVKGPDTDDRRLEAFSEIKSDLEALGALVIPVEDKARLLGFARTNITASYH